ncbi:hypothetical protein TWF106_009917 [Orbilia oligospora]|uniref:Pentacotripeptide-repeat region of PRORP domain-containing protein n=1 Tax=Orbilia oligospora TaxID=2813651 RepID=A0A7C8V0P8_ORBOL|nr:hypothetical protein TWF679_002853 [Orbilia oligospora]KAF3227405.1 hypothetical protein TWF106_009917 [Orbilia oligospora]
MLRTRCPQCLDRAYSAVLSSHGYPSPTITISQLIARRQYHHPGRGKMVRRPSTSFTAPPSTAVDKRGKPLTRGGEKSLSERRFDAGPRSRDAVETQPSYGKDEKVGGGLFDAKELKITRVKDKKVDASKIAQTVLKALNGTNQEHEESIDMLRELTSRYGRTDLVVAWNHVVEWKLKRGNIQAAIKLYNEMKKRGVKPDSYTYLRLLNGLADNAATTPGALGRALTVYYSLTAPSSTVKASIMHTNAALKVCAQAKDVDAMWDIAERIPDKGRGSADTLTYTTLLNGIRNSIGTGSPDKSIMEGRELWENILIKWQDGQLEMDEGLGCAMARLLLKSMKAEDWDEVLSLCHDVFGVPRLIPKIGTKARTLLPIRDKGKKEVEEDLGDMKEGVEGFTADLKGRIGDAITAVGAKGRKDEVEEGFAEEVGVEDGEGVTDEPILGINTAGMDSAASLITSQIPSKKPQILNNGLSVILEACLSLRAYDTAANYWDLITESYNVLPDRDNYNNRMRCLSMQGDSAACLAVAEEMIKKGVELNQNLFFIAMNGCRRNKKIAGFKDAYKLLDLMQREAIDVTSKVLIAFIRTATVTEDVGAMRQAWMKIGPGLFNIHKLIDPTNKSIEKVAKDLECCQEMVSLSDAILSRMYKNKLDRADKEFADWVEGSRQKIHKYINEYFNSRKGDPKQATLIEKLRGHEMKTKVEKEKPQEKKLTLGGGRIGRWEKFGTEEMQRQPRKFDREPLGEGEVSLEGMNFKPRKNTMMNIVGARGGAPRTKNFLRNKDTDYTAHFRPNKERKKMERASEFQ